MGLKRNVELNCDGNNRGSASPGFPRGPEVKRVAAGVGSRYLIN
jgi:hypothetical protein